MPKYFSKFFLVKILVIYTTLIFYTEIMHHHSFSWIESESCDAYLLSISQNSDNSTFNQKIELNPNQELFIVLPENDFEYYFYLTEQNSTRAPPQN